MNLMCLVLSLLFCTCPSAFRCDSYRDPRTITQESTVYPAGGRWVNIHIHIYIYIDVCIYTCIYIYMCMYRDVCIYICICIYNVCMCMRVNIYTRACCLDCKNRRNSLNVSSPLLSFGRNAWRQRDLRRALVTNDIFLQTIYSKESGTPVGIIVSAP